MFAHTDTQIHSLESRLNVGISRYRVECFGDRIKQAYRSQRKCYLDFCLKMGYPPVPAPPGNLCRYAVYLWDYRQLSASSIPKYLNVLLMHLECNLPSVNAILTFALKQGTPSSSPTGKPLQVCCVSVGLQAVKCLLYT